MARIPDPADTRSRRRPMRWLVLTVAVVLAGAAAWCPAPVPSAPVPASAAAPPASAPAGAGAPHAPAHPRQDLPGLPNFAQVSPVLYRGAQPTPEGFRELKRMGIKTVVSLRSFHDDHDQLAGTGLRYVHYTCNAWHPEDQDVVAFLKVMEDPANYPVFVHCAQGSDRTGCMVAVYRMVAQGWTPPEAMAELPNFGFHPIWTQITAYLDRFDPQATRQKVRDTPAQRIDEVP